MSEQYINIVHTNLEDNITYMNQSMHISESFDLVYRVIYTGGRKACFYFIDGFCKDEIMQKMLQSFMGITKESMPKTAYEMLKKIMLNPC